MSRLAPQLRGFCAALLLTACGKDILPVAQSQLNYNLTPQGGVVPLVAGLVTLVVPAGAVAVPVVLVAHPVTSSPTNALVVSGTPVAIIAPPTLVLNKPVIVVVRYASFTLPAGVRAKELRVGQLQPAPTGVRASGLLSSITVDSVWQVVPGSSVSTDSGTVAASLSLLGVLGVMGAPVATVSVKAQSPSVAAGGTDQLTATPLSAQADTLPNRTVTWASSKTTLATVSGTGLVTGVAAGTDTITATSEGVSGSTVITVQPAQAAVASVTVSPATTSVQVPLTVQLAATTKDAGGATLTGRTVTWASSNAAVASVNGSGLVTGVAAGTDTITATSESANGKAVITVLASGTFATPDIVNNASFEPGDSPNQWDGFTNWSGGLALPHTLDTTHAFAGRYAVKRVLPVTTGSDIGGQFANISYKGNASTYDRIWSRFYFYFDAAIAGILKFHIFGDHGGSTQLGGLFISGGYLNFTPLGYTGGGSSEWDGQSYRLVALSTLVGGWHSAEIDYWRNNDTGGNVITTGTGEPSIAIWIDGTQLTSGVGNPPTSSHGNGYWKNNRIYVGARTTSAKLGFNEWAGVLNGFPANTVAANLWFDRIALSSLGRIGP